MVRTTRCGTRFPRWVHGDGCMINVVDGVLLVGDIYSKILHAYSEGEWKHAHVLPEPG